MAGCIDLVVHLGTEVSGTRRVREIAAVPGRVEGDVVEIEPLFVSRDGRLVRADGYPPHLDRFAQVGIDVAALLSGTPPQAEPAGAPAAADGGSR